VLKGSEAVAFIPSEDLERSERFYQDVLGLQLVSRSPLAVAFTVGGATLRVTKVDDLRPQSFTVFGWQVRDLRSAIGEFRDRGIALLHFEGLDQDDQDVWTTPSGDLVCWFHDPDLNVLSLTQLVRD
jgi:catechol 2,3-dioxygenase-like lactoylglutathione lyase family enzyme